MLYCPLNDPDDGGTSGDRRMARQIRAVLIGLGHEVQTLTSPRTHTLEPDGPALERLKEIAAATQGGLLRDWESTGRMPELWLSYHNYHKAPDLLGSHVSAGLAIPYVIIEGSFTASKHVGPWAARSEAACHANLAADLHFCFTRQDRDGLVDLGADPGHLIELPPFIDTTPFERLALAGPTQAAAPVRMLSVAMMRHGVKLESYRSLAAALSQLSDVPWSLTLVGDGPARAEVERLFGGSLADRVLFEGLVPYERLPDLMARHDVFVWPGLHEPFGLVFLEAQAAGLPVVAFHSGGVADTVRDGETAWLLPEGDIDALGSALARLLVDRAVLRAMGAAARRFVLSERGLVAAAKVIGKGLDQACSCKAAVMGKLG